MHLSWASVDAVALSTEKLGGGLTAGSDPDNLI